MNGPWDNLSRMIYPGRLLAIGRDRSDAHHVILYAITGRSPSSQARRLEREGNGVWTKPTDPETLKKGNPELLVYPAILFSRGIAISNGRQTADIDPQRGPRAVSVLAEALGGWSFEPDAPIFTPRISGCVCPAGSAALSIIKRGRDGRARRSYHEIDAGPGRGALISTYAGDNREPLAAFEGEPLEIKFDEATPEATAEAAFAALRPAGRAEDFRVALACVFARRSNPNEFRLVIVNRWERTGA